MIELRQLRYFMAAVEQGSFRRASNALEVQESSISRSVRDLEDGLGASLFQRHRSGVCLTLAGQRFLIHARTILQEIEAGAKDVAAVGRAAQGQLKIGVSSSLASGFLHDLLCAFDRDHQGVLVELIDSNPTDHIAAIRQLRLDVAFVIGTTELRDCETDQLWSERVFAVLPHEHALAKQDAIGWGDIARESFIVSDCAQGHKIREYLVQRIADLGELPEVRLLQVGRDNLFSLVAVGRGLTLTNEAMTMAKIPGIVYRPIANETVPFSAVWSTRNDNPALRRFLSLSRSMASGFRVKQSPQPAKAGA